MLHPHAASFTRIAACQRGAFAARKSSSARNCLSGVIDSRHRPGASRRLRRTMRRRSERCTTPRISAANGHVASRSRKQNAKRVNTISSRKADILAPPRRWIRDVSAYRGNCRSRAVRCAVLPPSRAGDRVRSRALIVRTVGIPASARSSRSAIASRAAASAARTRSRVVVTSRCHDTYPGECSRDSRSAPFRRADGNCRR